MIKYSIIIISYNQHRLTERVLQSMQLLDSNPQEFEVIVVDDGSSPKFSQIVDISRYSIRYYYLSRSRVSGRARARNYGAEQALGEFLIFLDGDCLVNPNFIKSYDEYIIQNKQNVVLGTSDYIIEADVPKVMTTTYIEGLEKLDPENERDFRFDLKERKPASILSEVHYGWLLFISRNFCIKKSIFSTLGGFNESFLGWGSEDVEFAYRLSKSNQSFDVIANKVFHMAVESRITLDPGKYASWVENIGLFYSIHQDPRILLLLTQEKLIYNHFCLGEAWDNDHQLNSFLDLEAREEILSAAKIKSGSGLNLGIISTVSDCSDSIKEFITYHTKIGFNKIYLFLDDNDEDTYRIASQYRHVKIFTRSEALYVEWQKAKVCIDPEKFKLVEQEVMVRQELNFFIAYALAKSENIDWVVHLDIDELFYPNGSDLQNHFKALQFDGFRSMTYLNYESISTAMESSSLYRSAEYFKINYFKNKYWFFNASQKRLLTDSPWLKEKYFNFYQNGKSSVNTYGKSVVFYDVHSIVGDGKRKMGGGDDPIILHFPCARYSDFCRKYKRLGKFSDHWMGFKRAGEFIDDIHLACRDLFCDPEVGDDKRAEFYRNNFLMDEEKVATLIDNDLARRITFHQEILASHQTME